MNPPRTDTPTLIAALVSLARDIESTDGVANAAIAEAADRLSDTARTVVLLTMLLAQEAGELSEGQLGAITGLDRVTLRELRLTSLTEARAAWTAWRKDNPPEAERVTTTLAKKCPTCDRHYSADVCPSCG